MMREYVSPFGVPVLQEKGRAAGGGSPDFTGGEASAPV